MPRVKAPPQRSASGPPASGSAGGGPPAVIDLVEDAVVIEDSDDDGAASVEDAVQWIDCSRRPDGEWVKLATVRCIVVRRLIGRHEAEGPDACTMCYLGEIKALNRIWCLGDGVDQSVPNALFRLVKGRALGCLVEVDSAMAAHAHLHLFLASRVCLDAPDHGDRPVGNMKLWWQLISGLCPAMRSAESLHDQHEFDVQQFAHSQAHPHSPLQAPASLRPKLRGHQCAAVEWMIQREMGTTSRRTIPEEWARFSVWTLPGAHPAAGSGQELPPMWLELHTAATSTLFYCPAYGWFMSSLPQASPSLLGGILADEMGLGKTIEVLALILMRPAPPPAPPALPPPMQQALTTNCFCGLEVHAGERQIVKCDGCSRWFHAVCMGVECDDHSSGGMKMRLKRHHADAPWIIQQQVDTRGVPAVCPMCQCRADRVSANTTIVVCPSLLLTQWQEEILRHTTLPAAAVLTYTGVGTVLDNLMKGRPDAAVARCLQPWHLAQYRIILTTYDVLQREVYRVGGETQLRSTRFTSQTPTVQSPLVCVRWHRICLDETQMVNSPSAQSARMAQELAASHRWCVSGTPLKRGLDDFIGLFQFLHAEPLCDNSMWQKLVREPSMSHVAVHMLRQVLPDMMWRNTKLAVADQLGIPPQFEEVIAVSMTPLEAVWLKQQFKKISKQLLPLLQRMNHPSAHGMPLTRDEWRRIVDPLTLIRQVCIFPRMGLQTAVAEEQGTDAILSRLIKEAQNEGEGLMRECLGYYNGLAGIARLQRKPEAAVKLYEAALQLISQFDGTFRADKPPHIHTLIHLANEMERVRSLQREAGHEPAPATAAVQDAQIEALRRKAADLRAVYLRGYQQEVCDAGAKWVDAMKDTAQAVHIELSDPLHGTPVLEEVQQDAKTLKGALMSLFDHIRTWFHGALSIAAQQESFNQSVRLVLQDMTIINTRIEPGSGWTQMRSVQGFRFQFEHEIEKLEHAYKVAVDAVCDMMTPTAEDLEASQHCDKCRKRGGPLCRQCKTLELYQLYAKLLVGKSVGRSAGRVVGTAAGTVVSRIGRVAVNVDKVDAECVLFAILRWLSGKVGGLMAVRGGRELLNVQFDSAVDAVQTPVKIDAVVDAMKKEASACLHTCDHEAGYLSRVDEVLQAMDSMRLAVPGEVVPDWARNAILQEAELPLLKMQDEARLPAALQSIDRARGRYMYLQALDQRHSSTAVSPEQWHCSIHQGSVKRNLIFLPCGHTYCKRCIQAYTRSRGMHSNHPCPECREPFVTRSFVVVKRPTVPAVTSTGGNAEHTAGVADDDDDGDDEDEEKGTDEDAPMTVANQAGVDFTNHIDMSDPNFLSPVIDSLPALPASCSYGSKINIIVRSMLHLSTLNPVPKTLIFSQFTPILHVVQEALRLSHLESVLVSTASKAAQRTILGFQREATPTILLLPIKLAGQGLNLVEATHIVFLEPVLAPSLYVQAVGRVHRMSQTKPTYVHKFIVRDSVEEAIHMRTSAKAAVLTGAPIKDESSGITRGDVLSLFQLSGLGSQL